MAQVNIKPVVAFQKGAPSSSDPRPALLKVLDPFSVTSPKS
jgi:hypothetical protein